MVFVCRCRCRCRCLYISVSVNRCICVSEVRSSLFVQWESTNQRTTADLRKLRKSSKKKKKKRENEKAYEIYGRKELIQSLQIDLYFCQLSSSSFTAFYVKLFFFKLSKILFCRVSPLF